MSSVRVISCGPPKAPASLNIKLDGVGSISNVQYDDKRLRVWRAYRIGRGKYTRWDKLNVLENSEERRASKIVPVKTRVTKQKRKPPTLAFFHVRKRDVSNVTNVTRICSNT